MNSEWVDRREFENRYRKIFQKGSMHDFPDWKLPWVRIIILQDTHKGVRACGIKTFLASREKLGLLGVEAAHQHNWKLDDM